MESAIKFNHAYLPGRGKSCDIDMIENLLAEDAKCVSFMRGNDYTAIVQTKDEFVNMIKYHCEHLVYGNITRNELEICDDGTIQGNVYSRQKSRGAPYPNKHSSGIGTFIKNKYIPEDNYETCDALIKSYQIFQFDEEGKIIFLYHYCNPTILDWKE